MKKSIPLVALAALLAVGSAFATRLQVQWWNVNNPIPGRTPGIYQLSQDQVKGFYCQGVDNVECAYLISNPIMIVKKP